VEEEKIEMDGEVLEALGSGMFRVTLNSGHSVPPTRRTGCAATESAWLLATGSASRSPRTTQHAADRLPPELSAPHSEVGCRLACGR
jgi:hypothetical protein